MFCHKCKCCSMMWWSGFFGLAALMHTLRLIAQANVQVNGFTVPMTVSIAIAAVAAVLSFICCKKGCGACSCSTK